MVKGPFLFVLLALLAAATVVLMVFLPAGRWDYAEGWGFVAVLAVTSGGLVVRVLAKNPALAKWRLRPGTGTRRWDVAVLGLVKVTAFAVFVVGAFDGARHGAQVPLFLWPVGAALHAAGTGLLGWAMAINPHFETTVRIQSDRDHRVIRDGPYRFVRHPGYAGFLVLVLGSPLMLRSWLAYLPLALLAAVLVVRTALEDRMLRRELEGYEAYAGEVRARLLPGIW